ncbi:MAG: hypothetical protein AAGA92_15690 [Planctomycetota bacterium]
MGDDEALRYWGDLQKRHRVEIARAVERIARGRSMQQVADLLGYTRQWVGEQLDIAGITTAAGAGGSDHYPLEGSSGDRQKDVRALIKMYRPDDNAEGFVEYMDRYKSDRHTPKVAERLARAEWAGEAAVADGVIQEDLNQRDERVNRIVLPDAPSKPETKPSPRRKSGGATKSQKKAAMAALDQLVRSLVRMGLDRALAEHTKAIHEGIVDGHPSKPKPSPKSKSRPKPKSYHQKGALAALSDVAEGAYLLGIEKRCEPLTSKLREEIENAEFFEGAEERFRERSF